MSIPKGIHKNTRRLNSKAIPKIIHYCWFGGAEKPKLAQKCIKSWKKHCKGYELIEWSEKNFDISKAPLYVRQAYEAKKWAFVTDYVRLFAMTQFGGIYMDTDVEVVKNLDKFLENRAFSGFENETMISTGIMASEKDFPLFCELLKYYDEAVFIKDDGSYDVTTNVILITNLCLKHGLRQDNSFQVIDGFALYPKDYFCPKSWATHEIERTKNTVTIHHFAASWSPDTQAKVEEYKRKKKQERRQRIKRYFSPKWWLFKILGEKNFNKLKKFIKRNKG